MVALAAMSSQIFKAFCAAFCLGQCLDLPMCSMSVFRHLVTAAGQAVLASVSCIPGAGGLPHPSILLFPLI